MGRKLGLKSMVWTRRKKHSMRTEWRNKNSKDEEIILKAANEKETVT